MNPMQSRGQGGRAVPWPPGVSSPDRDAERERGGERVDAHAEPPARGGLVRRRLHEVIDVPAVLLLEGADLG